MRETIKQLQERWTPELTMRTLEDAEPLSPFGRLPSGLWDFRGLGYYDVLPECEARGWTPTKEVIENVLERACFKSIDSFRFSECDFTHARFLRADILRCEFDRCLFASCDLRLCSLVETRFERCRFRGANYRRAFIDTGSHGTTAFTDCEFVRCNFAETIFYSPLFRRVAFVNCRSAIRFRASSFEDVSFSGKFGSLWFSNGWPFASDRAEHGAPRENPMRNVSFADAEVNCFDFTHRCPLSRVVPPRKGRYILVERFRKCLLEIRAAARKEPDDVRQELQWFFDLYFCRAGQKGWWHSEYTTQEQYLISLDDIDERYLPRTAAILTSILLRYRIEPVATDPAPPRLETPHAECAEEIHAESAEPAEPEPHAKSAERAE